MTSMKAMRIHDYGGPEEMHYEDVPRPAPLDDEVLVRTHAASVNPVDWKVRDGALRERLPLSLPVILGGDFSGTIEAVGSGVTGFNPGMAVFGMTRTPGYRLGAFAEYVTARAVDIAPNPATLDHINAASVPLAGLTAWQALFDVGGLRRGQKILIHAGAGGVGGFAIQFAHGAGAHVITTTSTANTDYVRQLGADEVIDYRTVRFERVLSDLDMVLDLIGGETQSRSYDVLRPGGVLVNAWGAIMTERADAAGARGVKVAVTANGAQLAHIGGLIDSGRVCTSIGKIFPIAEAASAFELNKAGHVRGKIVLTMN
jgi:NADPH:quinone reductase-like Zn-dependent oxidoreductase